MKMKDMIGKGCWYYRQHGEKAGEIDNKMNGSDDAWWNKNATLADLIDALPPHCEPEPGVSSFAWEEYVKEGRKIVSKEIHRIVIVEAKTVNCGTAFSGRKESEMKLTDEMLDAMVEIISPPPEDKTKLRNLLASFETAEELREWCENAIRYLKTRDEVAQ